jgi:four helix bundle protein
MLSYQRLDVYRCAVKFVSVCFQLVEDPPRGLAPLADQLRRAVVSIPLNIAEGAGRTTAADKSRFFSIARGSAMECGAILDVFSAAQTNQHKQEAEELLIRIVEMLSKMVRFDLPP